AGRGEGGAGFGPPRGASRQGGGIRPADPDRAPVDPRHAVPRPVRPRLPPGRAPRAPRHGGLAARGLGGGEPGRPARRARLVPARGSGRPVVPRPAALGDPARRALPGHADADPRRVRRAVRERRGPEADRDRPAVRLDALRGREARSGCALGAASGPPPPRRGRGRPRRSRGYWTWIV